MNYAYFRWPIPLFLAFTFSVCVTAQTWRVLTSGIDTNLRGVSATVDAHGNPVVWASGSKGVVLVSQDEGEHWKRLTVAEGQGLDFRGIAAFGESTAYVMSSGEGAKSRIYKTTDGGTTWKIQYSDERKEFFLDAIQCLSEMECYALGDPMDGKFVLLRTKDGEHWQRLAADALKAMPQEGAFAASNSCLHLDGKTGIYFVTGGPAARMFHSADMGKTWRVIELPLAKGNASSGAFSIAMSGKNVVVAGGDYQSAEKSADSAVYSTDGGRTWKVAAEPPSGYRSAVASSDEMRFISAGTNGSDVSDDRGNHWRRVDSSNWNALAAGESGIWAVGPKGTVARLQ
jgi:photosystem II stability/assembly factor-like uncharacterized protein